MREIISFIKESNRIERIFRDPTEEEIQAHSTLLDEKTMTVGVLEHFVDQIAPGIKLRDKVGMDVRIGHYYPPRGGPEVRERLTALLAVLGAPYLVHHAYESLHPFMDGNGRSGRALWLWQHNGYAPLNFLQQFYYQALDHGI